MTIEYNNPDIYINLHEQLIIKQQRKDSALCAFIVLTRDQAMDLIDDVECFCAIEDWKSTEVE